MEHRSLEQAESPRPHSLTSTVSGLDMQALFELSPTEEEDLRACTTLEKAMAFLHDKLDRVRFEYSESKGQLAEKILESGAQRFSNIRTPMGTPPSVDSRDIRQFFAQKQLELDGMSEGGREWEEPFGYSFNRYGYDADSEVSVACRLSAASEELDWSIAPESRPDLFSQELHASVADAERRVREAQKQKWEENVKNCEEQVRQLIDSLNPSLLSAYIPEIERELAQKEGIDVNLAFVRKQLPTIDVEQLQGSMRPQLSHPYNFQIARSGIKEVAERYVHDQVLGAVTAELARRFRESLSERGEFTDVRSLMKSRVQSLRKEAESFTSDSPADAVVDFLRRLSQEVTLPSEYRAGKKKAMSREEAMKHGTLRYLHEYRKSAEQHYIASDFEHVIAAIERACPLLAQSTSTFVRSGVLSDMKAHFGNRLQSQWNNARQWSYPNPHVRKSEWRKQEFERFTEGNPADIRFLRQRFDEYYAALDLPLDVMFQADALYSQFLEDRNSGTLLDILKLLQSCHSAVGPQLHLSFSASASDLTEKQRNRIFTACHKIRSNINRFDLHKKVARRAWEPGFEFGEPKPSVMEKLKEVFEAL